jgi:apolipoprotein D and lipocalin family protein
MNRLLNLSLLSLIFAVSFAQNASAALQTVSFVDLNQYAGTWYQIARNPIFFEARCVCSRQVLGAMPNGQVSVYNSCNDTAPTGTLEVIKGVATNEDPTTNSKFTVDFNLPNKGEYWIIGLDPQYRFAVVSDPTEKSLYILSKSPTLDPQLYQTAFNLAKQQVDTSQLQMTNQQNCTYPQ